VSAVRGREREVGRRWAEGEGVAGTRGGSSRGRGLDLSQLGGEGVLFLFFFSKIYIHFFILFF
jgi:hypothetical protein